MKKNSPLGHEDAKAKTFNFKKLFPTLKPYYLAALPLSIVASSYIPWTELSDKDWIFPLATRISKVDGRDVHYPTPAEELIPLLQARQESAALRHLAQAKLELGDQQGALEAMERWAGKEGAEAWMEVAHWAFVRKNPGAAFRAADKALSQSSAQGLALNKKESLLNARVRWADHFPDLANPVDMRLSRSSHLKDHEGYLDDAIQSLKKAKRFQEADQALNSASILSPERRRLLRSELQMEQDKPLEAFGVLDEVLNQPGEDTSDPTLVQSWSMAFRKAYAISTDRAKPQEPKRWRATLEKGFDAPSLCRLATWFQGHEKGGNALELLRQMDRRHFESLKRADHQLLSKLYEEIDAIPEAFRSTLSAAQLGNASEQNQDLARLAHLALKAGGRDLAYGLYNDEHYRLAAEVDRSPGFWTGALSFMLTGMDFKESLARLESDSMADRTFQVARLLARELEKRAPNHALLGELRLQIMDGHVKRGEGREALQLLPFLEKAGGKLAHEGRRVALLAHRQTNENLHEEIQLMKARLKFLAPDGSQPGLHSGNFYEDDESQETQSYSAPNSWTYGEDREQYAQILEESLSRLEEKDESHYASLDLILHELDRLPDAEDLWLMLLGRMENWSINDQLGPRFEKALNRFQGKEIWHKAARWYTRHEHQSQLKALGEKIVSRFRASALFERLPEDASGFLAPDQPTVLGRPRMVRWADWVRLKALERFPHSPKVFEEAQRLTTFSAWKRAEAKLGKFEEKAAWSVVAGDELMEKRRWALLFVDDKVRSDYFRWAMKEGSLERKLLELEKNPSKTPVDKRLLFEGWCHLSQFERATAYGDELCRAYPGQESLVRSTLSLHRSLNGLESEHGALAKSLVEKSAPAFENPNALWTELGEMEEERGRGDVAKAHWQNLLAQDPRNPEAIAELATLLWDYNYDKEALEVVEKGRTLLARPHFYAFETGVLRENVRDLDGAIREYLAALEGEDLTDRSFFEQDQRSLRRLAQLLSRPKVYAVVEKRIKGLKAGNGEDEKVLLSMLPLGGIDPPDPGLSWDADQWIDRMDMPNDPKGRELAQAKRQETRPKEYDAIERIGHLMLSKAQEMAESITSIKHLEALQSSTRYLANVRWDQAKQSKFQEKLAQRQVELTPNEMEKVQLELNRAESLAKQDPEAAKAQYERLKSRISKLEDGPFKIQAEIQRLKFLESIKDKELAKEWQRMGDQYNWSLGVLEDRLAYLKNTGQDAEARKVLEAACQQAAPAYRGELLQRLVGEALSSKDQTAQDRAQAQSQARRSLDALLGMELEMPHRLKALHLSARLNYQENPNWDALVFAKAECEKLPKENHGELYRELATASDAEKRFEKASPLWIEALNRQMEVSWLAEACQSAEKAGQSEQLLAFFEKQHARSPRDVRWAVAVRDIKRNLYQVDGAIQAAKAAVAVRPDREDLVQTTVDLLVRADRVQEAADFLESWNRPRLGDENVARQRSELYARAGKADKALDIERAALAAFKRESPSDKDGYRARQARAIQRLMDQGLAAQALRLASSKGQIQDLRNTELSLDAQVKLALHLDQLPGLLSALSPEKLTQTAYTVREYAKVHQREALCTWIQNRIQPLNAKGQDGELSTWWPFVEACGMDGVLRLALAQRFLATQGGPWQNSPNLHFVQSVGNTLIQHTFKNSNRTAYFAQVNLPQLWVSDLARRDLPDELYLALKENWKALFAQVKGPQSINADSPRLAWSSWLDSEQALECWTRGASKDPAFIQELGQILANRYHWDRMWALCARKWQSEQLLAIVSPSERQAWFRFWEKAEKDPTLIARQQTREAVSQAVTDLVQGKAGSPDHPQITRLRGPLTVGEVLGQGSQWTFKEFMPRMGAKGENLEKGEDRIIGSRMDHGRLPGSLWGEQPGEAWYVLESLVRYRKQDTSASLVVLESAGGDTQRRMLAIGMARLQGQKALALELDLENPGASANLARLETRLQLLVENGQKDEAHKRLQAFLQQEQPTLTEKLFRQCAVVAKKLEMSDPSQMLDPQKSVGPAFFAYLVDQQKDPGKRFHTKDENGFHAALASRWQRKESRLSPDQTRYWLEEIWAKGHGPFPARAIQKLPGIWPHAAEWLKAISGPDRVQAMQALKGVEGGSLQHPLIQKLLRAPGDQERLLTLRIHMLQQQPDQALGLLKRALAGASEDIWGFKEAYQESAGEEGSEYEGEGEASENEDSKAYVGDPAIERLKRYLEPFKGSPQQAEAEGRVRENLTQARELKGVSADAWDLEFQITAPTDRAALAKELEKAWFKGFIQEHHLPKLCESLSHHHPEALSLWLKRWPQGQNFKASRLRAEILMRAGRKGEAVAGLFGERSRGLWTLQEEIQGFDFWRNIGGFTSPEAKAPQDWSAAISIHNLKGDLAVNALEARLKQSRLDALSALSALRQTAPGQENAMLRTWLALPSPDGSDQTLLNLRSARAALQRSHRHALNCLHGENGETYRRTMVQKRLRTGDINTALTDLARIFARNEERERFNEVLDLLTQRKATSIKALQTEFPKGAGQQDFVIIEGQAARIRPRDLNWDLLKKILRKEGLQ